MTDYHGNEIPGVPGRVPFSSSDLAMLWRIPLSGEVHPEKASHDLRERIKELNCLYGISQLAERNTDSIETLLEEIVNFVPHSWQYPEITCARIFFDGKTYTSDRFEVTPWRQSSRIYVYHEAVGECSVFYLEECPPADEGPFLQEERALLDAVAEQIGTIATRVSSDLELQETNRQLSLERQALQESNTALKIIMARIEQEKQEIRQEIKTNVDRIIMPILQALYVQVAPEKKKYVELLRTNLEDITASFVGQLTLRYRSLTPTEIAICNMIRGGMNTKEIAGLRKISESTVNRHRENIRRKLEITNQEVNLATFLQSAQWEVPENNTVATG